MTTFTKNGEESTLQFPWRLSLCRSSWHSCLWLVASSSGLSGTVEECALWRCCNLAPVCHHQWVQPQFKAQWCRVHRLTPTQKSILSYLAGPHPWLHWTHHRRAFKKEEALLTPRMDTTVTRARLCLSYPQSQWRPCHLHHHNHHPLMATEQTIIAFTDAVDLHSIPYVKPHYAAEQEVASFTLEGVRHKILLGHLTPCITCIGRERPVCQGICQLPISMSLLFGALVVWLCSLRFLHCGVPVSHDVNTQVMCLSWANPISTVGLVSISGAGYVSFKCGSIHSVFESS